MAEEKELLLQGHRWLAGWARVGERLLGLGKSQDVLKPPLRFPAPHSSTAQLHGAGMSVTLWTASWLTCVHTLMLALKKT